MKDDLIKLSIKPKAIHKSSGPFSWFAYFINVKF